MAAVAMAHSTIAPPRDEHTMDTRTPSPRPPQHSSSSNNDVADYQPDLSQEVSLLSTKLINAINYQTNLDDSLQHTRHELEAANRENARLRAEKKSLDDMVANGLLIRKSVMDQTVGKLRVELAKERAAREEAEKARKQTDAELESLTTALFEEANTMVAAARKDTEAVEKRNSQLKGQISDTELLLASQQEQLQDLKLTMGRMSERGDNDTTAGRDSIPSTPIGSSAAMFDAMQLSPNTSHIADIPPEHPLYFSQLLTPVLRSDIPAYLDFQDLLQSARKAMGHSRAPSAGNTSSGGLSSSSQTNLASTSSPSLPGAFSFSTNSSPQSTSYPSTAPPLKDSKFYKRSLVEDIEPTLRLDLAPGLSFLSRRTVLSSLLQGSMVVEPFMPQTKFYGPIFSCALCGESRKAEPYVRKHRFRTSEEESAQRYPLCDYCLGRTRAAGDFVGFLRMVRDGHWRAENEEEQKGAWEEAVRLRERMFWARQGGGVIPSLIKQGTPSTAHIKSARQSLESIPEQESPARRASQAMQAAQKDSLDQMVDGELQPREAGSKPEPDEKLLGLFKSHRQSMSIGGNLGETSAAPSMIIEAPEVKEPREIEPVPVNDNNEVNTIAPTAVASEPAVEAVELDIETKEPVPIANEPLDPVPQPKAVTEESVIAADDATIVNSQQEATLDDSIVTVEQSDAATSQPEVVLEESAGASDEPNVTALEPEVTPPPASTEDAAPAVPEVAPAFVEPEQSTAPDVVIPEPTPALQTADDAAPAVATADVPAVDESGPATESAVVEAPADTESTLQAPAKPSQRKNSSVLARVRAMESSPKPPGSFD